MTRRDSQRSGETLAFADHSGVSVRASRRSNKTEAETYQTPDTREEPTRNRQNRTAPLHAPSRLTPDHALKSARASFSSLV